IEAALSVSLNAGGGYEVPDIDRLFELSLPLVRTALEANVPRSWRVAVTGSFTHGTRYKVVPERGNNCEIADLLFVVEYRLAGGESVRNALLVQAKRGKGDVDRLWSGGDDSTLNQQALYCDRPSFV